MPNNTYLRTTRTQFHPYDDAAPFLNEFLSSCFHTDHLCLRSINMYYVIIRLFLRYIHAVNHQLPLEESSKIQLKDVTEAEILSASTDDLSSFLNYCRAKGNKSSSIRQKQMVLSRFFSFLTQTHTDHLNISTPLSSVHSPKKLPDSLTEVQISMLLTTLRSRSTAVRDVLIVYLNLYTGMSLSQILALNVTHGEDAMVTGSITIKNGLFTDTYVLPAFVRESLASYLVVRPDFGDDPALFVQSPQANLYGYRLTLRAVEKMISSAFILSGLNDDSHHYTIRTLQHTAAIRALSAGHPSFEKISALLGHSNRKSTRNFLSSLRFHPDPRIAHHQLVISRQKKQAC